MQQMTTGQPSAKPDPAPSRLTYRMQRLMLTPGINALIRVGIPVLLILTVFSSWYAHPSNRHTLAGWVASAKQQFQEHPQFMVETMNMTGADLATMTAVIALLPQDYPVSSFEIDLEATRAGIEALEGVKTASVRIGASAALEVRITPRVPVAIWRDGQDLRLIDADGAKSGLITSRADRLDLPLIAGDGAEGKIDEALGLFAASGPLLPRVRGLVRIGKRRWDMVLDRDQLLMLPAQNPVAAVERIVALHEAQDLLERDVTVVDFRTSARPTVRLTEDATAAIRRNQINQIIAGAGQ